MRGTEKAAGRTENGAPAIGDGDPPRNDPQQQHRPRPRRHGERRGEDPLRHPAALQGPGDRENPRVEAPRVEAQGGVGVVAWRVSERLSLRGGERQTRGSEGDKPAGHEKRGAEAV